MCKLCHGHFDPFTNSVIAGAHPHAGRHKTRDCHWLSQQQHHGIVGGGGCNFCHVQGWAPHVQNHRTHKCTDPRNPAGRNPARGGGAPVAGVHPCDFCRLHNPGVPHHRTHKCSDSRNPAGRNPARGGGAPVARGGGGAPAATPAYGTITNGQFWNGKGWRQILSIDHRPGGTLVTYRRQDGVSRQVQI